MSKDPPDFPPNGPHKDCESLRFDAILASVTAELGEGTVLSVQRLIDRGRIVAFCLLEGQRVGTITGTNLADLLECIERGYRFEARVTEIQGGLVKVLVEPTA